jgi:hypothetical protein
LGLGYGFGRAVENLGSSHQVSVVRDLVHGQVAYERIIPFTRHKSWLACVGGSKNVSNSSATKVSTTSRCTRIVVKKVLEIRDYLR